MWSKLIRRVLVWGLVASLFIAGLLGWALSHVKRYSSEDYECRFQSMPRSDDEFKTWIESQPGVIRAIPAREASDRLKVLILKCWPYFEREPSTDLDFGCSRLGYVQAHGSHFTKCIADHD